MNDFKLGNKKINDNSNVYIIAEAGSNHNGDIDTALKLVDIAVEAGADCVKFQSVTFETLTSDFKNEQLKKNIEKITLDKNWYKKLSEYCSKQNLDFMSTPTYERAVDELDEIDVIGYKIASMDLTNIPFLRYVASKGRPIILSRGMSTISEIDIALKTIEDQGNNKIALLHCVSEYPTKAEMLNLNQIKSLANSFGVPIGFSDHSESTIMPAIAVSCGAKIIEKHFTYDRSIDGFDHFYALDPKMLKEMISAIRETEIALGSSNIKPYESEWKVKEIAQRSIIASRDIAKGETINEKNLTTKRPGTGIPASNWDLICGRKVNTNILKNQIINLKDLI